MPGTVTGLLILSLFLLAPSALPSAHGTPPCPWFDYSVTRSAPLWTVTLYPHNPIPLKGVFYTTNQTLDPVNPFFGPWEPLDQHVGRPPRVEEPVTLQDLDSSDNLTRYDRVEILDEADSLDHIRLGFGSNETFVRGSQGINLEHNYQYTCYNAGPTPAQVAIPIFRPHSDRRYDYTGSLHAET